MESNKFITNLYKNHYGNIYYLRECSKNTPLIQFIYAGLNIKIVLEEYGEDIDIPHFRNNDTPLMIATFNCDEEDVKLLLKYNANPNLQNNLGITALMFAVAYYDKEIVELLLDHGANPNIENVCGIDIYYFDNFYVVRDYLYREYGRPYSSGPVLSNHSEINKFIKKYLKKTDEKK